jgi:hypothetical protein
MNMDSQEWRLNLGLASILLFISVNLFFSEESNFLKTTVAASSLAISIYLYYRSFRA